MKKRLTLGLAFVLAVSMMLSACGFTGSSSSQSEVSQSSGQSSSQASSSAGSTDESEVVEQVLTTNMIGSPTDVNPITASTTEAAELIALMYETLVRQDQNNKILPGSGLAESWTISDDNLVYTFTLRDAVWSDGTPITAQQFESNWKTVLNPDTASVYAYLMYPIVGAEEYNDPEKGGKAEDVGVTALDDKTLQVTLKEPADYFLSILTLSQFGPMPENAKDTYGDEFYTKPEAMCFNGPFIMTSWVPDVSMTFAKNESYWDADSVKLQQVNVDFSKETNTTVNSFDTGSIDVMLVQPEFLDTYRGRPGFVSIVEPVTEYLKFNLEHKYFSNEKIRRAFSLALNRVSYMEDFFRTGSTPAYAYVPPSLSGVGGGDFREVVGDLYYDRGTNDGAAEEAKTLLNEGIQEVGGTIEELNGGLSLIIGEGDLNLKTAQVLQQMWNEVLGVDVTVRSAAYAIRQEGYADKAGFTIGKEGWGADFDDAISFLELFETGNYYNNVGYSSAAFDEKLAAARVSTGDARYQLLQDAEKILIEEDFVIAPTFFQTRSWVSQDYVKGIVRAGIGVRCDYKWAYIEK